MSKKRSCSNHFLLAHTRLSHSVCLPERERVGPSVQPSVPKKKNTALVYGGITRVSPVVLICFGRITATGCAVETLELTIVVDDGQFWRVTDGGRTR